MDVMALIGVGFLIGTAVGFLWIYPAVTGTATCYDKRGHLQRLRTEMICKSFGFMEDA
jgi:hypothetical protein